MQAPAVITYSNDLILTEQMKEDDQDHGIFERRTQRITIDDITKTATYLEDNYYEYENSSYQVQSRKYKTTLKGAFKTEDDKIIVEVKGDYLHKEDDFGNVKANDVKKEVTGILTLQKTVGASQVAIAAVQLKENGQVFNNYLSKYIGTKFRAI